MLRKIIPFLTGFSLLLGNAALAADACKPTDITEAVDRYGSEPYGAAAWRVLHGLGDPKLDGRGWDNSNWEAIDAWKKMVAELAPDQLQAQDPGYDCRMGYPLKILNDHIASYGKTSPYIKQWIMSQSRVIAACSATEGASFDLPAPLVDLQANIAAIQNFDRAYQTASIAFYKDKPKAAELFRTIAASDSPHKAYARYNIANLLANSKDVTRARGEAKSILADPSLSSVHGITQELLGYISNLEDTPEGWTELINHTLDILAKPEAEILASEKLKADYTHAIYDVAYAGITAKRDDWWVRGELPENATLSKALVEASRKSPMALWMMTGQSIDSNYRSASWALVGEKWNNWTSSYIDRALALTPANAGIVGTSKDLLDVLKAKPDDQTRASVWIKVNAADRAVQTSCGKAPETAAVGQLLLQAVRLSALAGKFDEIYTGLNSSSLKGSDFYNTTIVAKLAQFLLATGNVEEGRKLRDQILTSQFFESVPLDRQDVLKANYSDFLQWIAEDEPHWRKAVAFGSVKLSNPLFNILPVSELVSLSSDGMFSEAQRALLVRAAWTRNYALGLQQSKGELQTMLDANRPIKEAYDAIAKEYPKLDDSRRLLLTILRNPRFGVLVNSPASYGDPIEANRDDLSALDEYDHNDKNWWCPLEPSRQISALRASFDSSAGIGAERDEAFRPVFDPALASGILDAREKLLKRHAMLKMVKKQDLADLSAIPSAPAKLTKAAISWAKASDGKDGAPEALALAVRATRYGCNWHGGHKAYSKPAQELLKEKFGQTEWAAKTPYWFDCVNVGVVKDANGVGKCFQQEWPKDELPK